MKNNEEPIELNESETDPEIPLIDPKIHGLELMPNSRTFIDHRPGREGKQYILRKWETLKTIDGEIFISNPIGNSSIPLDKWEKIMAKE